MKATGIAEAADYLSTRTAYRPRIGVVLGSGLGAFAKELARREIVPYGEIPGWPRSTAVGHAGQLVFGLLHDIPVAVMNGRAHLYEGYPPDKVVFGVRTLAALGVKRMLLAAAS